MRRTKISFRRTDNIEALLERLESLQITNKALEEISKQSDDKISVAPVPSTINNAQVTMLKSMIPDSE